MICHNCKKEVILNPVAFMNLDSYKIRGSVLTASECCGTGFVVRMKVSYVVSKYQGEKLEDDWGVELAPKTSI
jgi:hypothetical protein